VTAWLHGVAILTCRATYYLIRGLRGALFHVLFGLAAIAFVTTVVALGKWLARNDRAWLSTRIAGALSADPLSPAAIPIE